MDRAPNPAPLAKNVARLSHLDLPGGLIYIVDRFNGFDVLEFSRG